MVTGIAGVSGHPVLTSVGLVRDLANELAQTPVHYWEERCAPAPTLQSNLVMAHSVQVSSMNHLDCSGIPEISEVNIVSTTGSTNPSFGVIPTLKYNL